MFLKKIYVNGFKSFAEKTEIVIEKGITAIVGPNGSGKSNISDAIKWVLGEQSAKSLRGGKMDDIIFAGTEKRMPLGYAEVNLVFDNQTGIIPIEYNEVSIKRKLYKTGESEYYINKQQCRLKDIKELFMDTGIGRDGYSFIGQGRVEDILSPNSETRREVFEEAAGIVKYKTRKEEAIRKLDKTNDNLDRVEDIVHELEQRIEPLREQSEKANKYIELKSELKKYELNYFVHEYEKHSEQLLALEEQKKRSVIQKESLQKKRDSIERTITTEKEKVIILQTAITELENTQSIKNKEYENYLSLSNVQNEKSLLYQNNIQNVIEEIQALENRNKELQENIHAINLEKDILSENLKVELEKFNELNLEVEGYKAEIDDIIKLIDNEKNMLFELHKEINKMNSSKNTLESFVKNSEERIEQLSKEILSEESEKENKENIIKLLKQEKDDAKEHLSIKKQEGNEVLDKLKKSENQKLNKENEIKNISNKLSSINSKLSILNNMEAYYDGYYKSVKTLMNNKDKNEMLNKSILGTVADIVKTKKEYETAIEISLGAAIQNVIVNSESDASDIIEYLKTSKIGRVTFLPIEMIQERSLNNSERSVLNEPCVIDTADMLIDTDPKFKKVIKHLLGRILIVDNLKNGFKISKRLGNSVKIVSLQGDVINSGGSVTGGHISNNQNLLGRKREIEECKELSKNYSNDLQIKNDELNSILSDIKNYNELIENIKNVINEKNNLYNLSESKIIMLQEQLNRTEITIKKYSDEKQYIVNEKNKYGEEIFQIDKQIEENKKVIDEREKIIENIISQNESNRKNFEEYNSIILEKREQVSDLRQNIKLKEEKIINIDFEINRNINTKSQKEENLKNIETEISKATSLIEEYAKKSELLSKELSQINSKYQDEKANLLNFQNQIYEYQNIMNETNKNITLLLDDENNMNVKIEREKSKVEDISTKFWEEYEMNYAMALGYKDESISYSKLYNDLNTYKKEIKGLGNINIDSIEEYKEVKDRYDFLSVQKKDLIEAKIQLNDVIKELEIKMRDKFLDEFASIRIKFNEVFKKLFNGGNGDVYIEDESDALNSNIEIAVQPPGKKLSKISLLSGGEKSLTAIALLFAILKTKPTPFCILDEIEAALDDVNIFRFTQYLREFSKETQFLVITHRKGTMEYADTLYGATMEEKGVTKLVSLKLSDVDY
ncbi:chromosome segregation protein [Sedimentibacter acidaminivorans]|uniref:Chromosome partition protein Smc n=1 Tax=Sedimentibacter acidaminivorans TaxID=913099 RepID=A0ABS4GCS2_9FIRM|nr:chromosome segregation protein SMC [Sedimentibacter acidaminivorans]MBP1925474.1 chromosome segregation protein [Sedimentibacter acidaminivorans]